MIEKPRVSVLARTIPDVDLTKLPETAGTKWADRQGAGRGADGIVEFAGRLCYRSWAMPNPDTATNQGYLANIIRQAHFSVMEHASVTFLLEGVSRSFLAEITRHRHLSFSVVSQRFVDSENLDIVVPPAIRNLPEHERYKAMDLLRRISTQSKAAYRELTSLVGDDELSRKQIREAARAVMPNATNSPMVVSGNLRAWREVIAKRTAPGADAEIQEVTGLILAELQEIAPGCFQDFA